MGYIVDDSWDNCGPVLQVGNAAFGVYVRCGVWVARNLTDGFVPAELAAAYGSPEYTRKLVDAGFWEAVDGGYRVVDYLTLNPTGEKVRAKRQAEADRKARWRAKQAERDATRESRGQSRRDTTRDGRSSSPSLKGEAAREPPRCAGFAADAADPKWCRCGLPKANKIHFRSAA